MTTDRLPPHSVEGEQGILGCILLGGAAAVGECHERFAANPEVFYDLRNRIIFETLVEANSESVPPDLFALTARLKSRNQMEQVGGLTYVASLPDAVPSAANLPYYVAEVLSAFTLREIISRCTEAVGQAFDCERDVNGLLDRVESDIMGIRNSTEKVSVIRPMKELVREALDSIERYHSNQGALLGLSTGLKDLDQMTGGLKNGEMIVIAARPSMGKTALAIQIAEHVAADNGVPVGVFSLEMSASSLVLRALCSRAQVNARSVTKGYLQERDFPKLTGASGKLSRCPMWIDDTAGMTIETLRAKARRMVQQHGIKLLVIDYIQLILAHRRTSNRQEAVSEISRGIKILAKDLNLPVIALSQLSRDLEKDGKRKPRLSDLRESGAIEQDADVVGMLYRPATDQESEPDVNAPVPTNLLIAKQRNGPVGDVNLEFLPNYTRFVIRSSVDSRDIPLNY